MGENLQALKEQHKMKFEALKLDHKLAISNMKLKAAAEGEIRVKVGECQPHAQKS